MGDAFALDHNKYNKNIANSIGSVQSHFIRLPLILNTPNFIIRVVELASLVGVRRSEPTRPCDHTFHRVAQYRRQDGPPAKYHFHKDVFYEVEFGRLKRVCNLGSWYRFFLCLIF